MPSSIFEIDLKDILREYHRYRRHSNKTNRNDDERLERESIYATVTSASEPVSGWDESVADDEYNHSSDTDVTDTFQQQLQIECRGSLTQHVMSHGSWIYGIAEVESRNKEIFSDMKDIHRYSSSDYLLENKNHQQVHRPETGLKIHWKTSLAPHRIQNITSNESGTIIAATTDNGAVSIIRGRDGRVLATRRVTAAKTDEGNTIDYDSSSLLGISSQVSFVTSKSIREIAVNNTRDALLVQTPDQPALLVSNIQGDRLNEENDTVVTQATKSMDLQVIQIPSIECSDIRCLCGYFYSSNEISRDGEDRTEPTDYHEKIRLVLIHHNPSGDARLALAEYDLGSQMCHLIKKNISLLNGSEFEIDTMIGLRLTSVLGRFILALVAHPTICQTKHQNPVQQKKFSTSSKIVWLDPDCDLENSEKNVLNGSINNEAIMMRGEYHLVSPLKESNGTEEHRKRYQRSRIQALEFVNSFDPQESIAMLVLMENTGAEKSSEIQIMQAQVKKVDSSKMFQLGYPHMLYHINAPPAKSISFCPLAAEIYGPYSFRSKSSLGWNQYGKIYTFQTRRPGDRLHHCSGIGAIRLLITKDEFDKARALVHEVGMEVLLEDEFAHFHPAEIVLQRLRRSLSLSVVESHSEIPSSNSLSSDDHWNESLIGLGRSAGNAKGRRVVLEAVDYVLNWSPKTASSLDCEFIVKRLTSFLNTMKKASEDFFDQDVPSWITATYSDRVHALQERLTALIYLNSLLKTPQLEIKTIPEYLSVGSIDDIFFCCVKSKNFVTAEKIWRSTMRPKLTASTMVSSILQITSSTQPREYINLLEYIVLPNLSINHELLSSILTWSCELADEFDTNDENGLEQSIFLLETIIRATKRLRLKIHSSFAYYSPFVPQITNGKPKSRLLSIRERDDNNMSTSGLLSLDSSFGNDCLVSNNTDDSLSLDGRRQKKSRISYNDQQPNPTILELGRMKGGATRFGQIQSLSVEMIDENEGSVETKLEIARWLKLARSLGLSYNLLHLHNFVERGGARYASKELIRLYSSSADCHEKRYEALTQKVKNFCSVSKAGYDEALIEYSQETCTGRNTNSRDIEEIASIARCCLYPASKCHITKIVLQAALFCRFSPSWLTALSKDAIEWSAGDSSLRSELEEASRLLLIDGIVGRYCGNGAKELFHIDNPLHATRLLDFVSRHLEHNTVLSDTLDLCEAFHHLSLEDGCGRLIQNAILKGRQEMAINFLESLYERNLTSAHNVFSRVISFCIDLIEDNSLHLGAFPDADGNIDSSLRQKESNTISNSAYQLTKVALVHSRMMIRGRFGSGFTTWQYDEERLQSLLLDLERLIMLQQEHRIFVSLVDLNDPKVLVGIASKLLSHLADMHVKGKTNAASMVATQTKKVCSLLSRPSQFTETDLLFTAATPIACRLALGTDKLEALDFLLDLRILEATQCTIAARCCIAASLSYCRRLSKSNGCLPDAIQSLVMASSLLQDHVLSLCPPEMLGVAIDFSQLCDVVSQVLSRADEGFGEKLVEFRKKLLEKANKKRWSFSLSNSSDMNNYGDPVKVSRPILHPSWYVGDGLLLPPEAALRMCIDYCKQIMGLQTMNDPSMGIHAFVANRGAHALALRILSHSNAIQICLDQNETYFDELEAFDQNISIALLERYLGGTGNGITSGVVDSQLATSFLLCLPLKLAFKIYKSSLPTAINTRDFKRVVTLATIGKFSGSKDLIISVTGVRLGNWTRQNKFVSQCDRLATRANWWYFLEENNVNFNPHSFEDESHVDPSEDSYIASMIPALISNMVSRKDAQIDSTLALAVNFANAFCIPTDLPGCCLIEYLLSPTESDEGHRVREKVSNLNETVRKLLQSLSSTTKRIKILRKCMIQFESHDNCVDYERLSIIYALYQTELSVLISKKSKGKDDLLDNLYVEIDIIDRRRDALAILSSYFQGDKKDGRPCFSKFFAPMSEMIDDNKHASSNSKIYCSRVLGWETALDDGTIDPLDPLEKILRSSCSAAVTSALSPICISLGVPRGYIKVRSLITRFQKSCHEGASLPTFEDDVIPILNQLIASSDAAEVAEWCSNQYELKNPDKLICLEHALNYAIRASTEAESAINRRKESVEPQGDDKKSSVALARVKRISTSKDLLEDRLEITKILQPENKDVGQSLITDILEKLLEKLETEVWSKLKIFVPERFVDTLLIEASLLVAKATLCESQSLSVGQFRQLSHLVHRACNCIARKYSHVQCGYLAQRLTKRWLLYGDEQVNDTDGEKNNRMIPVLSKSDKLFPDIDEEDTMNFQMDLSVLKEDPSNFSMVAFSSMVEKKRLTSEEEPSCLEANSRREISELASHRSSLRIAFVMAFANGYHYFRAEETNKENDENSRNNTNRVSKFSKTPRRGLLSKTKKIEVKNQVDEHTSVLQHARDLIQIVFAKSTSVDRVILGINSSFDSTSVAGVNRNNAATITFAMRHRCLRVASVLVPQKVLEEVLNEDELKLNLSLQACSFGSFCAKELEEMGLPIPHSDLLQLSKMHFPSYARALWRHHRDMKGMKGRFLLLILELYLKESISDYDFFYSILKEIETLNLPRTQLLGFECIIRYLDMVGPENAEPFIERINTEATRIIGKLLQMVYADLKRNIEKLKSDEIGNDCDQGRRCAMSTLSRLSRIIGAFSGTSEGQRLSIGFCMELFKHVPVIISTDEEKQFLGITLEYIIRRIETENTQRDLFERLSKLRESPILETEVKKEETVKFPSTIS